MLGASASVPAATAAVLVVCSDGAEICPRLAGGWRNDALAQRGQGMTLKQAHYVLGHTPVEQQRLIRQARFLAPATEHFLDDAGVGAGRRVLDIGCGMGDVSMLLARKVGPQGLVVSIDLDQASLETARERATAPRGLPIYAFIAPTSPPSGMPSRSMRSSAALFWSSCRIRSPSSADCPTCCDRTG